MTKDLRNGFTLIEVLVVMGLLAIVGSLALVVNLDDYRSYLFRNERDLVVSVLQKARSQAVSNVCLGSGCTDGKQHGVRFEPNRYVIFQGSSYATRDSAQDVSMEANSSMNVSYSSQEIIFNRLSGQATPVPFFLQIQDSSGHAVTVTVNSEGRINW